MGETQPRELGRATHGRERELLRELQQKERPRVVREARRGKQNSMHTGTRQRKGKAKSERTEETGARSLSCLGVW